MTPRPKFGEGFSIPLEKDIELMDSWLPVTPEKPIPTRSNAIPVDRFGRPLRRDNLQEFAGFCNIIRGVPNYDGAIQNLSLAGEGVQNEGHYGGDDIGVVERNRMINHIARQVSCNGGVKNGNLLDHLWALKNAAANRTQISNSYPQVENWRQRDLANSLLQEQFPCSGSNTLSNGDSFHQITQDSLKLFDCGQLSLETNMSKEEWSRPERDRDKNYPESQVIENILGSPPGENQSFDNGSNPVIDLNETPQQKAPKRRKHRPKVVVENKPKRTPKATPTPKNTEAQENPTGKRKYVRRKPLKENATPSQQSQSNNPDGGPVGKSCKRSLNFDSEKSQSDTLVGQQHEHTQRSKMIFNLNLDAQVAEMEKTNNECGAKSSALIGQQNGFPIENWRGGRITNNDCGTNSTTLIGQQYGFPIENWRGGRITNNECGTKSTALIGQQNGFPIENRQGTITNNEYGTKSTALIGQQTGFPIENRQGGTISSHTAFVNHTPANYLSFPERQGVAASVQQRNDTQVNNFEAMARTVDVRTANAWQTSSQHRYSTAQATMHANGIGHAVFQARMGSVINDRTRQLMPPSTPRLAPTNYSVLQEARGNKRDYGHAMEHTHPLAANLTGSSLGDIPWTSQHQQNSGTVGANSFEAIKRIRIENGHSMSINGMPYGVEAGNGGSRRVQTAYANDTSGKLLMPQRNSTILNSLIGSNNIPRSEHTAAYNLLTGQHVQSAGSSHYLPGQPTIPGRLSRTEKLGEINSLNTAHDVTSVTANKNLVPPTPAIKAPVHGNKRGPKPRPANVSAKQSAGTRVSKEVLSRGEPDQQSSLSDLIDELVYKLERIFISGRVENAIVPYNGDRSVVPYDGDKKRKPRPKVDLDPETNRIWKLLMGKEGSECLEETDKEKQKWWEEERRVFRGRADSFIAKMHLVQGDRRFSKWKGSVVDSVIGVFLTQNVSDHLSSSAFMCLAAKFPPKRTCDLNDTNILVEEPEVCVVNPNENIHGHELVVRRPIYSQSTRALNKSTNHLKENDDSEIEQTSLAEALSQSLEEEVLSSQGSFGSPVPQENGGIRSSSGSNSEAEDHPSGCKAHHDHGFTKFPQMENINLSRESNGFMNQSLMFQEESGYGHNKLDNTNKGKQISMPGGFGDDLGHLSFMDLLNSDSPFIQEPPLQMPLYPERFGAEGTKMHIGPFLNSPTTTVNGSIGQLVEGVGETVTQLNGMPICGEIPEENPRSLFSQQPKQQQNVTRRLNLVEAPAKGHSGQNAPERAAKAFDIEEGIYSVTEPTKVKNNLGDSKSKEQVFSTPKAHDKANTPMSKSSKAKAERERNNAFDWDSLRREAQKNGKRERSKDTIDSLDYEAMRRAKVEEISGTIKARGMNNMLAERMKDFLDRLVKEHGSIDLEWLRDVPPDKAKDYLLSIRGLGLKSVECVRLLTLHHLAFPVDTNVGRIAVRLGWVPLQPLPESLQIHLLELYPLLETIQKYLWPRLCTLDQRTLYELHYQLITFGKVFCTKSKPNCNACPMRGECRHFASAFASARLSLPAPEERGVVTTTPTAPERNHAPVNNNYNNPMMPLPPPAENSLRVEASGIRNCEPIIEEPPSPSPEPEPQQTEADIEDAFWAEDPFDDIPVIKINQEQFAATVHNVMQQHNGEIREADLSRAIVAIHPGAVLPNRELKSLSRLRTEHHVYQLPDSHPLLEGMDRRELDDPSPYLLAIWSPGETYDLKIPPQKECKINEAGKLCNLETCVPCNSEREAKSGTVRGTILIPCRTAMRGSFPLNGTYFQVNEVFADFDTSRKPITVLRDWIWNLPRRIVYFGSSVTAVSRGLTTEQIQYSFWKGYVCVRAFERGTGAPKPLVARLHQSASQSSRARRDNN